ncbi:ABC transporter permease [Flammeovirgaceae bacterium]
MENFFPEVISGDGLYNPACFNPYIVKKDDNLFEEKQFYFADSTFFDVLTYPLLKGNPKTALTKPNSVVLTESMVKKYFGQEDPIGQTLLINGNKEYTVTGITKDAPGNSYLNFDFIGSFSSLNASKEEQWWSANYQTFALLDKNADLNALEQKTNKLVKEALVNEITSPGDYVRYNWTNIKDIHLRSEASAEMEPVGNIQYVYLFAAIAFLILLIACINYINLATARATFRAKEVGVRKVVGASKQQLIAQFISESVVITFCALVFAFLLAQLLLPLFNTLTGKHFTYTTLTEPIFLASVIGTSLILALLSGAYPAFAITSFKSVNILKGNFRNSSSGIWLRKGLVVFQFCVTLILIIGTLAIAQQIFYIQHKNLGYDRENTIIIPLDRQTEKVYSSLKSEFIRSGRVAVMGRGTESPVEITGGYSLSLQESQVPPLSITALSADEDFIPSLGMEIVSGRNFNENDIQNFYKDTTYAFMVNESALSNLLLNKDEALGKHVSLNGRNGEIVGVVKDFHFTSLHMPIGPLAIFSGPDEYNFAFVKLNPGSLSETLKELKSISNSVAPHRPFSYEFMDQQFNALYNSDQRMARLFEIFSTLAIVIACLGLLGLVSFSATQKTKEIGIRKVMGASSGNIILLITNEYTRLILLSILIAVPISLYAIKQMLSSFAYKTTLSPISIALAVLSCVLIAFFTASYQALKAATINPTKTLRNE